MSTTKQEQEQEDSVQKEVLIAVGLIGEDDVDDDELEKNTTTRRRQPSTTGDDDDVDDVTSSSKVSPDTENVEAADPEGRHQKSSTDRRLKKSESDPGAFPIDGMGIVNVSSSIRRDVVEDDPTERSIGGPYHPHDFPHDVTKWNWIEAELVADTLCTSIEEMVEGKQVAIAELAAPTATTRRRNSRRHPTTTKVVLLFATALVVLVLVVVGVVVVVVVSKVVVGDDEDPLTASTNVDSLSSTYTQSLQIGNTIVGTTPFDRFGDPLALSSDGTIVAVGSHNAHSGLDSGTVQLFQRTKVGRKRQRQDVDYEDYELLLSSLTEPTTTTTQEDVVVWTQLGNALQGEPRDAFAYWGIALSSSGLRVAVGAVGAKNNNHRDDNDTPMSRGNIRIYDWIEDTNPIPSWTQVGPSIHGMQGEGWFGKSVAISADGTIVAGNGFQFRRDDDDDDNNNGGENVGYVGVFRQQQQDSSNTNNNTTTWVPMGNTIVGKSSLDKFGRSLDLSWDGKRLAVGATQFNGNGPGYVQVLEFNGTYWNPLGQDLFGDNLQDVFGRAVSLSADGSIVACGGSFADYPNDNGENNSRIDVGMVRIYKLVNSNSWMQLGQTIWGTNNEDGLGETVALSDNGFRVAIGAGQKQNGFGYVQIYNYDSVTDQWIQEGQNLKGNQMNGHFGVTVGMSSNGQTLAVGALLSDHANAGDDSGHVQLFDLETM